MLAETTGMTAFLVTAHGAEAVTVMVVEPHGSLAHVSYRPGGRHPLSVGAPGLAVLAGRPPAPGERPEVALARERGWAGSTSEVIEGYRSVAVPLREPSGRCRHAVAVVFAGQVDEPPLAAEVMHAAWDISSSLG
jgi:DNA-binding IclR family transcriptional regulator